MSSDERDTPAQPEDMRPDEMVEFEEELIKGEDVDQRDVPQAPLPSVD